MICPISQNRRRFRVTLINHSVMVSVRFPRCIRPKCIGLFATVRADPRRSTTYSSTGIYIPRYLCECIYTQVVSRTIQRSSEEKKRNETRYVYTDGPCRLAGRGPSIESGAELAGCDRTDGHAFTCRGDGGVCIGNEVHICVYVYAACTGIVAQHTCCTRLV